MRRAAVLLLALVATVSWFTTETATGETAAIPNHFARTNQPLDFPILQGALDLAEVYWESRGVYPPEPVEVYEMSFPEWTLAANGLADTPGLIGAPPWNRIWLSTFLLEGLEPDYWPVRGRVDLCHVVIHERGHNAGLRHEDAATFPIMGADAPDRRHIAPRCWAWARHPWR